MSSKVLFDEDLEKIEKTCIRYPIGSYQAGEIIRISGALYWMGIDVLDRLRRLCRERGIDYRKE